mgnify:CR=1 FL=1
MFVASGHGLIEVRMPSQTAEAAADLVAGADALIGFCSADLLAAGTSLRWIQLPYAGAERCLAIPAVRERDLLVTNAQRVYGPEIAEHEIATVHPFHVVTNGVAGRAA